VSSSSEPDLQGLFVHDDDIEALAHRVHAMLTTVYGSRAKSGPGPLMDFAAFAETLADQPLFPEHAQSFNDWIAELGDVIGGCVNVNHPHAAAHLHCPPLADAVATEVLVALLNPSMDSYDQSGTATLLEEYMVSCLGCECFGEGADSDGVFTSGGTQSNLMGLLLARERQVQRLSGKSVLSEGLPADHQRLRILCSEHGHFSVNQAAMLLGMGERAMARIRCGVDGGMSIPGLYEVYDELLARGDVPIALFATAGTTDHGAIDDLPVLGDFCQRTDLWFHVDATYGGPLLFTRHRERLRGMERADSVALDFHKLMFQPIACGAFIARKEETIAVIRRHAHYLNREEDTEPNLVGKSLATTRRFDALKLFVSLRAMGRWNFEAAVDRLLGLASYAADRLRDHPFCELVAEPQLTTVLFRCSGDDEMQSRIRRHLLAQRTAVIAETRLDGRNVLKFTFMNPATTVDDVDEIIHLITAAADSLKGVR